MSNPFRGEVPLEIGGRTVQLRLTWDAHAQLVEMFGDGYGDAELSDVKRLAELVAMLSGGVLTADAVREASPPIMPTMLAVQRAVVLGWRGPVEQGEVEEGDDPFETPRPNGASKSRRSGATKRASVPKSSGP